MAHRRSLTKQMSLRDMLHEDELEAQHKRSHDDATEGDSCLAQTGTDVVRPLAQPRALSRRHLQKSASNRKIGRRGVGSNDKPDLRRSLSKTSCVVDEHKESSELVPKEQDVGATSSPRRSFRKVESQRQLLSKPDFRRSASKRSCAVEDAGSNELLDMEETTPVSPSKPTRTKFSSTRKSLRKANSQKGLNKPELRRSSSKANRTTSVAEEGRDTLSPRKASLSREGSSRAISSPTKSSRKTNSQRVKSQASLRRSTSSRNCVKECSGDDSSPSKQPRKQGSLRNANFQRTKSDFRRSQTMPPAPVDDVGDDLFVSTPANRLLLRSCSSMDYSLEENEVPARSGQRQRQEGITKVDWKKEVLNEAEPHEDEAKDTKTAAPRVGVKGACVDPINAVVASSSSPSHFRPQRLPKWPISFHHIRS